MKINLKSISASGLKGDGFGFDFDAPLVIVEGPNGAGKSAIADALAFLRGDRIGGAAVDGPGLHGLIGCRNGVRVDAIFEGEGGRRSTATRVRAADKNNTLRQSVLRVDGEIVDTQRLQVMMGSTPTSLTSLSPDLLRAWLATVGGGDGIADKREAARAALAEARKAEAAAAVAAEVSRQAGPDRAVRPDDLAAVEQELANANAARGAWLEKKAALEARVAAGAVRWEEHSRRERALTDAIKRLELDLALVVDADAPAKAAAAAAVLADAKAVAKAAADDAHSAELQWRLAIQAAEAAESVLAHVQGGTCPTCGQGTAGLITAVAAQATAARDAADAARDDMEAASSWAADAAADIERLAADAAAAQKAADVAVAAADAREARVQRLAELQAEAHAHRASWGGDAAKAELDALLAAPPPETGGIIQRQRRLGEDRAAVLRWQADLAARDKAADDTKLAKAHFETVRAEELTSISAGVAKMLGEAAAFAPPGLDIVYVDAGAFGFSDGAAVWYGPGLSAGQRRVLDLALVVAAHQVSPTRGLRALVVDDADQLSAQTMTALRDACELAVDLDQLDFVLITTCHPQPPRPRWQRIALGDDPFSSSGPAPTKLSPVNPDAFLAEVDTTVAEWDAEADADEPAMPAPRTAAELGAELEKRFPTAPGIERSFSVVASCPCSVIPCPCEGSRQQTVAAGEPRDFGQDVNLFRLRNVVKNLGPADREALKSTDYAPPAEAVSLFEAGLLKANGRRSVAGELAWDFLTSGKAVGDDGVVVPLHGADKPPPPEGAGVTVEEAKRTIRATGAGTAALRHVAGQYGEDHASSTAQACIVVIAQRAFATGMTATELTNLVNEAAALFPKSTRGGKGEPA